MTQRFMVHMTADVAYIARMREVVIFEYRGRPEDPLYFGGEHWLYTGQRVRARREQISHKLGGLPDARVVEIPGGDVRTVVLDLVQDVIGPPMVSVRLTSKKGEKAGEVYDGCPIKLACALEEAGAVEIVDEAAGVPVPSH